MDHNQHESIDLEDQMEMIMDDILTSTPRNDEKPPVPPMKTVKK